MELHAIVVPIVVVHACSLAVSTLQQILLSREVRATSAASTRMVAQQPCSGEEWKTRSLVKRVTRPGQQQKCGVNGLGDRTGLPRRGLPGERPGPGNQQGRSAGPAEHPEAAPRSSRSSFVFLRDADPAKEVASTSYKHRKALENQEFCFYLSLLVPCSLLGRVR